MNPSIPIGGLAYSRLEPYGTLSLTDTSPVQSFAEPLTLTEVKSYLNLPQRSPVDTAEDDTLSAFITAAREVAEIKQGKDLVRKQWDLTHDYFWQYNIPLRDPLVSVDLVKYRTSDGAYVPLTEGADYIVDSTKKPGIVTPTYNNVWPITFAAWPSSSVLIRFTSGYTSSSPFWSDAGQRIKVGMLLLISNWYNNRLPFDAVRFIQEYPFAVNQLLDFGANVRVR